MTDYVRKAYSISSLLQGATQKRSRAAANKATQNSTTEPSSHTSATSIEKRAPALSVSCLCHLLNAVLDDGLVADLEAQASQPASHHPSIHLFTHPLSIHLLNATIGFCVEIQRTSNSHMSCSMHDASQSQATMRSSRTSGQPGIILGFSLSRKA